MDMMVEVCMRARKCEGAYRLYSSRFQVIDVTSYLGAPE